jgi:hypothetical protein
MTVKRPLVTPVSLQEVYARPGGYSAKLLIDPGRSRLIDEVTVDLRDADGRAMAFDSKRWGTKLNVDFRVDSDTPDGVSIMDVSLRFRGSGPVRERFSFWVIK